MPMVVPETVTVTLTEPAAITATENSYTRLHVTAAHPPSPSVQRAAPHHIPAPESFTQSVGTVVYTVTDANGLYRKPLPLL